MRMLFEQLRRILGRAEDAQAFTQLQRNLGLLDILTVDSRSTMYEFRECGLSVHCRDRTIMHIFFHLRSAGVRSGRVTAYCSDFPNGITPAENRQSVLEKMTRPPDRSQRMKSRNPKEPEDFWDHYDLADIELTFIFDGVNEQLAAMSIHRPS